MKENKKKLQTFTIIILIIILSIITIICIQKQKYNQQQPREKKYIDIQKIEENKTTENTISSEQNKTIENIKNEVSITGDSSIYEVQEEYDGRKVLTVKASMKYKVAFAGMIKKTTPKIEELNTILVNNLPKMYGIWIETDSRNKILDAINNSEYTKSKYYIDEDGYLDIKDKNSQTVTDKKLQNVINGEKQYILTISSICYIVDEVTGEFLDYNFENMDKYQTYEYFDDDDKKIIFVSENKNNQMSDNEIINSVINLITM